MDLNNCHDDDGIEVVSKFVHLLGTSASQGGNDEALRDCLSSSLDDSTVVCSLPAFRVVEEPKVEVVEDKATEPSTPSAIQSLQDVFESSVRSVFHLPTEESTDEPSVVEDDESEDEPETELFFDEFTSDTIDDAPLALLRNLQDTLRQHSRSRLDEWKQLLRKHPSHEAQKLVKLLTYHKMITGCRGNTRMFVVGRLDEEDDQRRDCEKGAESETDSWTTNEDISVQSRLPGLVFQLDAEFFVKIRHGPRTFGTSSFTLAFETLGTLRYSTNEADGLLQCASFECDQHAILEQVKTKAHALVLNAIGFQAAESVRWTKTLLSDLWEGRHLTRDEDTLSDSVSVLTATSCFSGFSNGNSSVDSCPPMDPDVIMKSWRRSRRPLSRCLVPKNITTTNAGKETERKGWQHSIVYQLIAFAFLFAISVQFMKAKDFCHSFFGSSLNTSLFKARKSVLRPQLTSDILHSTPKGITFHRVISKFPDNSEFLLNFEKEKSSCQTVDAYGDNDCHFDWKDEVVGNFSTAIPQQLDEDSSVEADLVLEGHIPYKINCALCGQPCKIGLPAIHFDYSLHMPPCPVDLRDHSQDFQYQLWDHSPTEGMISISLEGNAVVYSSPGEKLAEFEVTGSIR